MTPLVAEKVCSYSTCDQRSSKVCLLQEAAWKSERARMQRDKAALQRECKALLERLKKYEPAVRPSPELKA